MKKTIRGRKKGCRRENVGRSVEVQLLRAFFATITVTCSTVTLAYVLTTVAGAEAWLFGSGYRLRLRAALAQAVRWSTVTLALGSSTDAEVFASLFSW